MKGKFLFIATIALMFGVASCTKDNEGEQTPSDTTQTTVDKRISKIYLTTNTIQYSQSDTGWVETYNMSSERRLSEEYIWENGSLAEVKIYSTNGGLRNTLIYSYDENSRLTKIEENNDNQYAYTFGYDDKGRLVSRKFYSADVLIKSWEYTYTDNCITSCYYVHDIYYTDSSEHNTYHITYQWSNGNMVSETRVNDATNESTSATYTYDNKHNPLYGVFNDEDNIVFWGSRSNRLTATNGDDEPVNFSYEYDSDGYPTSCESSFDMVFSTIRNYTRTKSEYEYVR